MGTRVACVIVGIDQWDEYTHPLIKQIKSFDSDVTMVVVDNASDVPYGTDMAFVVRFGDRMGYAYAMNVGASAAEFLYEPDWIVFLNNDVECSGGFSQKIAKLSSGKQYGLHINSTKEYQNYVDGWVNIVPLAVWKAVGPFDTKFRVGGYEDIDYSKRVRDAGFGVEKVELPFEHLGARTRVSVPGYPEIRAKNRDYFMEKHYGK